ncbi:retrovirus-related pol polyprotein from transposon TNT 1-94 [Tanacetum coccineum]
MIGTSPLLHNKTQDKQALKFKDQSHKRDLNESSKIKVVQIVLWYLDSGCSKHMTGNRSQLMNFVSKFLGIVRFGNDQIVKIMGYGDYQLGNNDWDRLFQPMFDYYFNPPPSAISPVQVAGIPRAVDIADSPVSTSINQDAPSTSIPSTQEQEQSPIISQGSSSNVRLSHTLFELLGKWTYNHPIANMIGDLSRSVSTKKQLQTDAMWCCFDAFLTLVEPNTYKEAMLEPSWIDAMQEEIHEFERLQVWELVPCPILIMLIKLKWIFKVKKDECGGVLKTKARLVAKRYRKEEGINFEESFAPVATI